MRDFALFFLNGQRREVRGVQASLMLADWLRTEAQLPGTKIVCAEGDCGACTVLRAFPDSLAEELRFEAINSCIATVAQMDGSHVVTVEGLQSGQALAPAQAAMLACHGSQCGYCTPGFVMALSALYERHPSPDAKTASNYLTGNLCRCTGYAPILEAAASARVEAPRSLATRYLLPAHTAALREAQTESLCIEMGGSRFFAPVTLAEAAAFAADARDCKIIAATTDLGVQVNKGKALPPALLSLHLIPELYGSQTRDGRMSVGARVTLARLRRLTENAVPEFSRFLDLFASPQIKNVATLAGNIANASPIGDTLPFLLVADAAVHAVSLAPGGNSLRERAVPLGEFFQGYKKLALAPGEIITRISFALPQPDETLRLYKVSQRKDLDISAIGAAFSLRFDGSGTARSVRDARIALGGVAATPLRVPAAEQALRGASFDAPLVERVATLIAASVTPLSDLRGSQAYRRTLAANLFRRFGAEVLHG